MNNNMTIDEALEQSRKDFKDLFENQKETTMTENKEQNFDTLLVKKCLDIVKNNNDIQVTDDGDDKFYTVCLNGKILFWIAPRYPRYTININHCYYRIPAQTPGVKELYDTCAQKYYEKTQQRENAALNFLDDYVAKKQENKAGFWQRLFNRQK